MNYEKYVELPTPTIDSMGDTVLNHPAFGTIKAQHVTGNQNLFNSDFNHRRFMELTITGACLKRDLSQDWIFAGDTKFKVHMSEAQWISMVSGLDSGSGTPCTITYNNGRVPTLPAPEQRSDQFRAEMMRGLESLRNALNDVTEAMDGALTKTKVVELRRQLESAATRLDSNTTFIANQFDEHMTRTVEIAKTELNQHAAKLKCTPDAHSMLLEHNELD